VLIGAMVAVGGALGTTFLGDDPPTRTDGVAAVAAAAQTAPQEVPLPVPDAEPGETPPPDMPSQETPSPAPAPTDPPADPPADRPGDPSPVPDLPAPGGLPSPQPPQPAPAPRQPAPAPRSPTVAEEPARAPATAPGSTATAPAPPPLVPYVPPPTASIPADVYPALDWARRTLKLRFAEAAASSQEREDIGWLLELDRRYGGADDPEGRRRTIQRALRANAWWFVDRASPERRVVLRDPEGVLLTYREGHGFMVNPVATTGRWRGLNDELTPEQLAEPLLAMGVARSAGTRRYLAWEYYDVPDEPGAMVPGVSGMAQSRLAELLSNAYRRTGDARFVEAAGLALAGLTVPVDRGGALSMVRLDDWDARQPWFVERAYPGADPWKGAALNGFMVTLLSLRNAANRLNQVPDPMASATTSTAAPPSPPIPQAQAASELARRLADRGSATLSSALGAHDLGDWSLYGLLTPGRAPRSYRADLNYHCYHVFLLRALARPYPGIGFEEVAERWQGYVDDRALTCPPR